MWIATTTGFLSAVKAKDDTDDLFVRARVKGDLTPLILWVNGTGKHAPEIITYEHSDYPWRVRVTKDDLAGFLVAEVLNIDYGNFKSAVAEVQGKPRSHVYSGVWSALLGLERLDPEARPAPAPWWLQYGEDETEDRWAIPGDDSQDDDDWYDVDEWLSRKSIHDMTDAEWLAADESDRG